MEVDRREQQEQDQHHRHVADLHHHVQGDAERTESGRFGNVQGGSTGIALDDELAGRQQRTDDAGDDDDEIQRPAYAGVSIWLCGPESVQHLVSRLSAKLRDGLDQSDALASCFPAGTVSGAPKVRAIEIIRSLEPTPRGVYAGAVGYFDYAGNMDTCIAIRTLSLENGLSRSL